MIVETDADVIKWSGGNGIAIYNDYVAMMEGDWMECRGDLIITLQLKYESGIKKIDTILKGIEIFKLSNPDNNLAGVNCAFTTHAPFSRTPRLRKLLVAFGNINTIATGIILVLTLLNFIVYHLNCSESTLDEEELHRHQTGQHLNNTFRRFSLVEIWLATNYFDDELVIGKGGFGNVYKGLIDRTTCVAIKRKNSKSNQGVREFRAEIDALSKFRHNHVVSLIGYCDDCYELILVYEYIARGTLVEHLHKTSRNGMGSNSPLSWERRLNICIGAARGLDFLHTSSGAHHGIIHGDVKSANILLDENWVAKVSDFGLSRMDTSDISRTHISTLIKGTIGYLDPVYMMTGRLSKRSDVYGFGVVLLEVLCGKKATDTLEEEQYSLATWGRQCIREGTIDQLVDPSVKEQITPHCLRGFAEIANKCLHDQPNERPTMAEVVARLELIILELQGRTDSYTEQVVIDVGGTSNEGVELSITSENSPSVSSCDYNICPVEVLTESSLESITLEYSPSASCHYSVPPVEVINESSLESISPGTTKNMEVGKKKDYGFNHRWWMGWQLNSKTKAYPMPEVHCHRFSLAEI
ncbi:receptor-like protein kinase FERONIA [Cornus florida]|uniref:receptor-like protein kinase FERONIA n=1 Tax=Cornus florida TaxID=4283 RepID=UPI0028A1CD55|nr:receptor-like protein kinase FERONIA [Cornus florida]XP_059641671.1 receptor-like protein kinase FERONIA [Cornus florida]XP_059641672.1 receptor-like protein kinase FERONIA [Cornus florida]